MEATEFFQGLVLGWGEIKVALATAAIEVPIFWLSGYRKINFCLCFFVANLISNLLLNEFLTEYCTSDFYQILEISSEIFAFILEIFICNLLIDYSKKLFFTILLSNCLSYLLGNIYYHYII